MESQTKNVPTIQQIDRLATESDKAWFAYQCFRDLGPSRSVNAAWRAYAETYSLTARAAPSSFRAWVHANDWEIRAQNHDVDVGAEVDATPDLLEPHARDLVEFAVQVAKGKKEVSKEQASVLNKLLGYIIEPKKVQAGGATFNGPTQINLSNLTPEQLLEAMRAGKK